MGAGTILAEEQSTATPEQAPETASDGKGAAKLELPDSDICHGDRKSVV